MPPRVFVSYSHDNDAHKARVDDLVARLRSGGVIVVYDEDVAKVGGPDLGWQIWCERQLAEAECFDGRHQGTGRGVFWEARYIQNYLYEHVENPKMRPLVFDEGDRDHIPASLRSFHVFLATHDKSYAQLLGWLGVVATQASPPPVVSVDWLPPAEDFARRLADRQEQFERFRAMLAGRDSRRAFLVQGPSSSGKSALISECILYSQHRGVRFSRIDFKGGLPLEDVFETLVLDIGKSMLPETLACERSARSFKVIADLQELQKPCFIAFDTYQEAPQGGQDWIEQKLLPRIGSCPALVVAVAGQKVPEHSARSWAPLAYVTALPPILSVEDWFDYAGRAYGSTAVTREEIQILTRATNGNPGLTDSLIGSLAQRPAAS
jgi:hypothetical protein